MTIHSDSLPVTTFDEWHHRHYLDRQVMADCSLWPTSGSHFPEAAVARGL